LDFTLLINSGNWFVFYFGVSKAGAVPVTLSSVLKKDELHAYLKSRLSSFKVPKEYRLVEDFPKSPAGKILKRELKKLTQESGG
jgi:acyl-CoA synthetase (AMP-forming)/AMP-acid ligase II